MGAPQFTFKKTEEFSAFLSWTFLDPVSFSKSEAAFAWISGEIPRFLVQINFNLNCVMVKSRYIGDGHPTF